MEEERRVEAGNEELRCIGAVESIVDTDEEPTRVLGDDDMDPILAGLAMCPLDAPASEIKIKIGPAEASHRHDPRPVLLGEATPEKRGFAGSRRAGGVKRAREEEGR